MHTQQQPTAKAPDYLDSLPEQLVVRGLRAWMFGLEFNDMACLMAASDLYEETLGGRPGAYCNALMGRWVRQLWRETPQKLSFYPPCCKFMTHDECMAAGLIAALQHGDADAARIASGLLLKRDAGSGMHGHVDKAADIASALAECGQMLIRVPKSVVERISVMHIDPNATRH